MRAVELALLLLTVLLQSARSARSKENELEPMLMGPALGLESEHEDAWNGDGFGSGTRAKDQWNLHNFFRVAASTLEARGRQVSSKLAQKWESASAATVSLGQGMLGTYRHSGYGNGCKYVPGPNNGITGCKLGGCQCSIGEQCYAKFEEQGQQTVDVGVCKSSVFTMVCMSTGVFALMLFLVILLRMYFQYCEIRLEAEMVVAEEQQHLQQLKEDEEVLKKQETEQLYKLQQQLQQHQKDMQEDDTVY